MLTKEIHTDRRQWRDQITGLVFSEKRDALRSALEACREQTIDGVPTNTSVKVRRLIHRSKSPSRC